MNSAIPQPKTPPAARKPRSRKAGAAAKGEPRTGILVLGMHRSGTSAITRVLNLLGVELGDKLMPAQPGVNDKGFWEHVDAVAMHERLLHWNDSNWSDIRRLPSIDLSQGVGHQAVEDARALIRSDFADAALWAIKDPRMSLFAPIWLQAMADESVKPKIIIAVRHPGEVAASLQKRDGLTRGHAYLLWGRHVMEALRASEGKPRAVSDYAGLLRDWRRQVATLAGRLAISWPTSPQAAGHAISEFLSEDDRHHRQADDGASSDDPVDRCVHQMYAHLARIADGHDEWQQLAQVGAEFERLAGALVPHLAELLRHVWAHADRASRAEGFLGSLISSKQQNDSPAVPEQVATLQVELAERDEQLRSVGRDRDELTAHASALATLRSQLESQLQVLQSETEVLRSELRARDGRMDALQQVVAEKEQRLASLAEQGLQKHSHLSELRRHADALEGVRRDLEQQLKALETESGMLRSELHAREGRMDVLQQVVAEKEQRLASLAEQGEQQLSHLSELRRHADGLEGTHRDLEQKLQRVDAELEVMRSELRARDGRMDALQQVVEEKEQRLVWLATQGEQRLSELVEVRRHASALEDLRRELEQQLSTLESEAAVLRSELNARDGRMNALQLVLAEKELRLASLSEQSEQRHAELSGLRAHVEVIDVRQGESQQLISMLESEAAVLRAELLAGDERAEDLNKLVDEKDRNLHLETIRFSQAEAELRKEKDDNHRSYMKHLETAERARMQAEGLVAELRESVGAALQRIEAQEHEIAGVRHAMQRRDEHLKDVTSLLEMRSAELVRVLDSNSWRVSAPLRWIRNAVVQLLRGRQPARYEDMLRPMAQVRTAPPPPVTKLLEDDSDAPSAPVTESALPVQRAYLDALFEDEKVRRGSDYVGSSTSPQPDPAALRAKAIAFYLPQFHPFPENDEWWGKGFTEWTNVTKAVPQFLGHHQPQLPADLGFYDLRLPDVIRQQTELARQYGIHGFCFHYYWFGGKRLLERPLDLFMENRDIDFPFCICWANENWTRRWDGQDSEILMSQEHSPENDLAFIRDLIPYLQDPRYIRVNGKPLVIVYRPSILPDCAATLNRWREYCRTEGVGEVFLAMVQFDVEDPRPFGFDAAMEFPPHKLARGFDAINGSLDIVNPDYQGHVIHYQSIVDSAKAWPKPDYPMVRGVFPGWDNEARRPGKGYTFAFSTPDRYKDWLGSAVDYAEANPVEGESLVMINAWNEWAEGAHLEPDTHYGHAFLQATREAVEATSALSSLQVRRGRPRIVVVSHDAHPHGAQYLALHIVRELDEVFGFDVDVVLLGEGRLTAGFARHATVHEAASIAGDDAALMSLAQRLRKGGAEAAIVNTTVSGIISAPLKDVGMRVVTLVHELPGLIQNYRLERHAQIIGMNSDRVVFAARQVRDGFAQFVKLPEDSTVIRPQGLFTRSRYLGEIDNSAARAALRHRLGISQDAQVVLTVGYGDHRKGLDILGDVARELCQSNARLHFVWVGHYDESLMDDVRGRLGSAGVLERFHSVGLEFDTDDFYAGADVYALTSREDPFPSVVLEALAVGLPVLAFSGTGGAEQLLERGCGWLVADVSAAAFADRLGALLDDKAELADCAAKGRIIIAREYGFGPYVADLLEMLGSPAPRVSVVVPNYNYGELLQQRLESIAGQSLPPYEIIVLDDCSTDSSLEVLESLHATLAMDFEVIRGQANSGSVFRQWLKGVERATGEYVWIAEADDLAAPRFLETVVRELQRDASVLMSYCQSSAIGPDGDTLAANYLSYTDDLSQGRWLAAHTASGAEEVAAGLAVKNTIPNVSAVVFRRAELLGVLREHIDQICSYRIAGDWLTYLLLLERGRTAYSPLVMNHHRRHPGSVTIGANYSDHLREVLRVQKFAREHYSVPLDRIEMAFSYSQSLYEQFGLASEIAPRMEMHDQLGEEAIRTWPSVIRVERS